jgi:hypothetical protein
LLLPADILSQAQILPFTSLIRSTTVLTPSPEVYI